MDNIFSRLFTRKNRPQTTRKTRAPRPKRSQPSLEVLEARITPANKIWTGAAGTGLWSTPGNWYTDVAPVNGDTVEFDTNLLTASGAAAAAAAYNTTDDIHSLIVANIDFDTTAHAFGAEGGSLGGAQSAAHPTAYTINGNATTGSLIITNTAAGAGIDVVSGVNTGALVGFTETLAATLPIQWTNAVAATPAATISSADVHTQLTINGTIATNFTADPGATLDVVVAGGAADNASIPGVNLNGVISGNMSLQKDGTGTLLLAAVNTYTGPQLTFNQSINSGVVIVGASDGAGDSGLGAASVPAGAIADTVVNGQAAATAGQIVLANGVNVSQRLDLNSDATGGGLTANGALATWSGPVQFDAQGSTSGPAIPANNLVGTLGAPAGDKLVIGGVISGGIGVAANATNLNIVGNGTVEFANDNTYSGLTTVGTPGSSTTLLVDKGDGLGTGRTAGETDGTTVVSGSSVVFAGNFPVQDAAANPEDFNLTGTGVANLGALQVAANGTIVIPGNITINGITAINVNSGTLDDQGALLNGAPAGELVKIGAGTMLLDNITGTASSYAGGTDIQGGILQDRTATANTGLGTGTVTIEDGTTLQMGASPGPAGIDITNNIIFKGVNPAAGALGSLEMVPSGAGGGVLDRMTGNIQLLADPASQVLIAVDAPADSLLSGFPAPFGGIVTPGGPGTGGGFVLNKPIATGATPQPSGTLDLDGPNSYGGLTSVDNGTLNLIPQANGQLEIPGNLVIGDNFPNTAAAGITPASALVKMFNFGNSIAATSAVTINADGELDLNGLAQTIGGGLTMTGGSIISSGGPAVLTLTSDVTATGFLDAAGMFHTATIGGGGLVLALNATAGGNRTFTVNEPAVLPPNTPFVQPDMIISAVIQDNTAGSGPPASNLIKAGGGSLYLSGANTYTGTTSITAGFVSAQRATALGVGDGTAGTEVSVTAGAALLVDGGVTIANHLLLLNGAGFVDPVNNTTWPALGGFGGAGWTGPITLQTDSTIGSIPGGGVFTLSNIISGAGNLDVLGPNGSFAGGTVVMTATSQGGSAALAATANSYGSAAGYGGSGFNTIVEPGATLTLAKVEGAPGAHPGTPLTAVPGALEIKGAAPNFPGALNGIGPFIPGGVVNVNAGIFAGATAGIEIGTIGGEKAVTINSGGTMNVGVAATAALSIGALTFNVGSTTGAPNGNPTINIGSGAFPGSQLQLTADVTAHGAVGANAAIVGNDGTINQLLLSGTRTFNVFSASAGSTELDLNLSVGIGNAVAPAAVGGVIETGGGTMEMSGAAQNTYGGNTNVNTGALLLGKTAVFAAGGSAIPANTTLTIGTGAGAPTSVLVQEVGANWQVGGSGVASGGASIVLNSDGLFNLAGNMDRIGGAVALDMLGGIMALSGGTLFVDGSINDPNPPSAILQTGTLNFDNGIRTITVGPAGSATNGANLTISAVITAGGLIKAGAGQLILSAPLPGGDTYLQNTTITDGKLTNNTTLASAVNVIPAAGDGTVIYNGVGTSGPLTAGPAPAGTVADVAPGDSPGTLHVTGDDTWDAGSQFDVLIGAFPGDQNTADFSQLIVSGAANLGNGNANLNVTVPGSYPVGTTFDILHAGNGVTGNFKVNNAILLNGATFVTADGKVMQINYGPNDVILTLESPQTTTTVSGSPNPQVFGHSVTFTAVVTDNTLGTAPTGTVEFYINSVSPDNDLGTGTALVPNGNTATSTFTTSTLPSGADTIIAVYNPTGNFQTSQGTTVEHIQAVTTSALSSSPNPSNLGQQVTFTDVVTDTSGPASPTGSVTFTSGTLTFTTSNLVVGGNTVTATWITSALPAGVDSVTATYTPTGDFVGSSATINQTVNAPTGVSVSGNPNPVIFGHQVVLTATVTNTSGATTPQGSVEFFDGNTDLGAGTALTGAGATATSTFTTSALPSGPQTIRAVYTASPGFQSGSTQFTEDVLAVTTSALSSSPNPSNFGQSVMFTDVVTNTSGTASPTGSVTFTVTGTAITFTTSNLVVGGNTVTATWNTPTSGPNELPSGVDTVVATYNPTGDFVGSSASINQTVNASTTVAASGSPNPVTFGHVVTLTATVTNTSGAAAPQGSVEFFDGNTDLGAGAPGAANGNVETWSFQTSALPSGPQTIKAVYTASSGFQSGSATFTEDVLAVTTTSVTSNLNPSNAGQSVTFTATVTNASGSASPTGTVEFFNGMTDLGPGSPLTAGGPSATSTFTTSSLPSGSDTIIAVYTPTGDFVGSQGQVTQTVNGQTSTTVSGNPNPSVFGGMVTITATVTNNSGAATPTGSVEFFNGNVDLGPGTALTGAGSTATSTFSTTSLPPGDDTIRAVYTPSGAFVGSNGSYVQHVQAGTTTTVSSSSNPSVQGNPVTFTATVVNNQSTATPTGSVEFEVNGTPTFGPVIVSGSGNTATATWTTSNLPVGPDVITAIYTPTGDFVGSQGQITQNVIANVSPTPPAAITSAVLKSTGELDLFNQSSGAISVISPGQTILSITTALNTAGQTVVYAIVTANKSLWEYNQANSGAPWTEISAGQFTQISGADTPQGNPVVFAVVAGGNSMWEFNGAWTPLAGVGVGAPSTQPGPVTQVSAVSTPAGEVVFAITQTGSNVWRHTSSGWSQLSTGFFTQISAGINGLAQPVVYGIVQGGTLWEQNPEVGTGLNGGWTELSGSPLASGNGTGPQTFTYVAAGGADTVFAITANQGNAPTNTLWQHKNPGWTEISAGGLFAQIAATETEAGGDLVFAVLSNGNYWDYNSALLPSNPWNEVQQNGAPLENALFTAVP